MLPRIHLEAVELYLLDVHPLPALELVDVAGARDPAAPANLLEASDLEAGGDAVGCAEVRHGELEFGEVTGLIKRGIHPDGGGADGQRGRH